MLQPQCRTCGQRHAIGSCAAAKREMAKTPAQSPIRAATPCPHCGKMASDPVKPPFDKAAYQREYMRQRRKRDQSNC